MTTDGKSFEITTERMPQGSPILDAAAWLEGCAPGQIDINRASLEELVQIVHIGASRAEELIAKRPFTSLDDLLRITGIGQGRLGDIKKQGLACVEPV